MGGKTEMKISTENGVQDSQGLPQDDGDDARLPLADGQMPT